MFTEKHETYKNLVNYAKMFWFQFYKLYYIVLQTNPKMMHIFWIGDATNALKKHLYFGKELGFRSW